MRRGRGRAASATRGATGVGGRGGPCGTHHLHTGWEGPHLPQEAATIPAPRRDDRQTKIKSLSGNHFGWNGGLDAGRFRTGCAAVPHPAGVLVHPAPPRPASRPALPVLVAPALRLTTFGGFALLADERPLGAAAGQRRPLAVLALLAAGGEAGASRDRIVATLWPDVDPERGRRTLTQTLYSLRRATGVDDLFLGITDVRLNAAVVACDALDFDQALAEGRLADAVALYRGPFLDGFRVPGAEEFERWADGERQRRERRCADALRTLARRAQAAGDLEEAVAWSHRLVALDPVDSTAALALVDACGRAGDLAGARRAARAYAGRMRDELGLPPAPAVVARLVALERELAAAPALPIPAPAAPAAAESASTAPAAVEPAPADSAADAVVAERVIADAPADAPGDAVVDAPADAPRTDDRTADAGEPEPAAAGRAAASPPVDDDGVVAPAAGWPGVDPAPLAPTAGAGPRVPDPIVPRRRRLGRPLLLLGAAAALGTLGVTLARRAAPPPPPTAAVVRADVIAVLPFALETADPGLAFLGEGAADLLARRLTGGVGPRAVAPTTVLAAWEATPTPSRDAGSAGARARALAVARRVGAGEALVGRVGGSAARLALSAVLLDATTGAERAVAAVSGPADSVAALVDALAVRLLARRSLGEERAGAFAEASLPVLRAYLRGEAAYRDDRLQEALARYEEALARDSTFAPAALGLAMAADRLNGAEQHDRGLALAWAARERLGARDRAWLLALAGPRWPDPSPVGEQIAAWEQAVALAPDRAEAWSELGERFFYDGALLGIRAPEARAAAAFGRALALDSTDASAGRHLVELAVRAGDRAALRRLATPARLRAVGGDVGGYLAWRVALATDDTATLARLRGRLPSLGAPSLRAMAMAAQHDGVGLADGARALRILAARAALAGEQLDALLAEHSLALNQGRPVLALDVTERLQDAQPGSRAHLRLRVLDALYAEGDAAAAEAAARELAGHVADDADTPGERALQRADACVLAQWRVAPWGPAATAGGRGELALARRDVALLRDGEPTRVSVPVGAAPRACAELVEAMLAVATGARDARARVDRLDARMLTGPALGDASAWATLAVARLYERLGDPRRALNAVRQRPYLKGWPRYQATALRTQARLAAALGDPAAAAAAWRPYLALRVDPEPPLRAAVAADRARARAAEREER